MESILCNHVSKRYKGEVNPAVQDFHLSVDEGELLVLTGPRGSGKSTMLHMLAGLEEISSGELYIGGKYVNYAAPKDREVAMVMPSCSLYPNLTVFENIAIGLKLLRLQKYEIAMRINRVAHMLGLTSWLERKPGQLKEAEHRRVELGRALAREPKVLLLDNPLSLLDVSERAERRAEIVRLHQDLGQTMVFATDNPSEAIAIGGRIVVMKEGVIQQIGSPSQVMDEPANPFVTEFVQGE